MAKSIPSVSESSAICSVPMVEISGCQGSEFSEEGVVEVCFGADFENIIEKHDTCFDFQ